MKKPYRLKKRGNVYQDMRPWETWFHSTGCTRQRDAEHFAMEQLEIGQNRKENIYFKAYEPHVIRHRN